MRLTRRTAVAVLVVPLAAGCGRTAPGTDPGPPAGGDPAAEVREAYAAYRTALLAKDGPAAADRVTASTAATYEKYRDLALTADEPTVRRQPVSAKLVVLIIRHRMTAAALHGMTGRGLLAHGVREGWIGKDSVARLDLGPVAVRGNHATAPVVNRGRETGVSFQFAKEDGRWRVDLEPLVKAADRAFGEVIRRTGRAEDEFLLELVESVSGSEPSPDIWEPMQRAAAPPGP